MRSEGGSGNLEVGMASHRAKSIARSIFENHKGVTGKIWVREQGLPERGVLSHDYMASDGHFIIAA